MISLTKRNLKLYFNSWENVLLSLIGSLISFVLYIVFLKQSILTSWQSVPHTTLLLDPWLIGGTLTVTAVTTTLNCLGQMINDQDHGRIRDFAIMPLSFFRIQLSYLFSAFVVGILMQIMVYGILQLYFNLTDGLRFSFNIFLKIVPVMILSSLTWTIINAFILSFVKNFKSAGTVDSIVGTAAGFFAGVYIPIGSVPTFAQNLMKLTPAPYDASLYRQILMGHQINATFKNTSANYFEKMMGVKIDINGLLNFKSELIIMISFAVIVLLFLILKSNRIRKVSLKRG